MKNAKERQWCVCICKFESETERDNRGTRSLLSPTFLITALPLSLSLDFSSPSHPFNSLPPPLSLMSLSSLTSSHQPSHPPWPSQSIKVKEQGHWQTNDLKQFVSEHSLTPGADNSPITNPFSPFRESPSLKPSFRWGSSDLN